MTSRTRVALVGMGRMGHAIDALASQRDVEIVARLGAEQMKAGIDRAALNGAEVAIEFSVPEHALENAIRLLGLGCPVVIGTTGWKDRLPELESAVQTSGCAALWSPNFSVGVQLFLQMAEHAGMVMKGAPGFDAHIVETHHAAKVDAPSGTALAIGERLTAGSQSEVPISSVRVGSVPGTHEVVFDAPFEQIRLVHEARDRRVFADGAILAARWLAGGRTPALYTMRDVLGGNAHGSAHHVGGHE
jgi:4-hydroxy-tetrahydrodipicolinate reductase